MIVDVVLARIHVIIVIKTGEGTAAYSAKNFLKNVSFHGRVAANASVSDRTDLRTELPLLAGSGTRYVNAQSN